MCKSIGVTKPPIVAPPEGAAVSTQSILEWVISVTSNLLPSQSKTLAALVAAAVRTERLNLATIGRKMAGEVSAKHTIKRAWRFTCNRRVEVHQAMAGVIKRLTRKRKNGTKGVIPIPDGQTLPLTVALAQVGGVTSEGDKKNVDIVRRGPDGKATVLVVNTDDLLKGKNNVADLNLRSGDILYVQTRSHPKSAGELLGSLGVLSVLGTLSHL